MKPYHTEDHTPGGLDDEFHQQLQRDVRTHRNTALANLATALAMMAVAYVRAMTPWNGAWFGLWAGVCLVLGLQKANQWHSAAWMLRMCTKNIREHNGWSYKPTFVVQGAAPEEAPRIARPAEMLRHVYDRHGWDADRRSFSSRYEKQLSNPEADAEAQRANLMIARACHAEALAAWAERQP